MTPTRHSDSPGDHSQEHGQTEPTAPVPPPPFPRTARLRARRLARRHPRPTHPSTVWLCAQDDLCEGTGVIANWLLTAVIKIVTTYTQPGQRVLLLAPSPFAVPPVLRPPATVRTRLRHGPYDGLLEAGWTVVRLGRGIRTQTTGTHPDPPAANAVDPAAEFESGLRPHGVGPDSADHSGQSPDRLPDPDATATESGPDRFDLIITAAESHTLDWLRPTDWVGLLTPNGILAVITQGDRSRGRLHDPAGPLVRTAHHTGLCYLDRIALLHTPVRNGALAASPAGKASRSSNPYAPSTTRIRHSQVHDDLLVFTRQPSAPGATDGEETSDE